MISFDQLKAQLDAKERLKDLINGDVTEGFNGCCESGLDIQLANDVCWMGKPMEGPALPLQNAYHEEIIDGEPLTDEVAERVDSSIDLNKELTQALYLLEECKGLLFLLNKREVAAVMRPEVFGKMTRTELAIIRFMNGFDTDGAIKAAKRRRQGKMRVTL